MKKIAIAGLGTVGCALIEMLAALPYRDLFSVVAVSARNRQKDRGIDCSSFEWVDNPVALADLPVDIIIELIGGAQGAAYELVKSALSQGKHVVTANKALLAHHGDELQKLAQEKGVALLYEAAVAGVIPILKTIEDSLHGNQIHGCYGILNGTCNYILTRMEQDHLSFADALAQAQKLGYAEADPTFDIDGTDTAHKTAILSAQSFGHAIDFDSISYEGIDKISDTDIANAAQLGYRIKLLGMVQDHDDGTISQAVFPAMISKNHALAKIEDSFNAVFIQTDKADDLMLTGRGAGGFPTATAVLSDMMAIDKGLKQDLRAQPKKKGKFRPLAKRQGRYYLHFQVQDRSGVLSRLTTIMSAHSLSVYSLLQEQQASNQPVPIIIVTHHATESDIQAALNEIGKESFISAPPKMIRIVDLD